MPERLRPGKKAFVFMQYFITFNYAKAARQTGLQLRLTGELGFLPLICMPAFSARIASLSSVLFYGRLFACGGLSDRG
jgi:hypothetical protein